MKATGYGRNGQQGDGGRGGGEAEFHRRRPLPWVGAHRARGSAWRQAEAAHGSGVHSSFAGKGAKISSSNVLSRRDERLVYECDGYVIDKQIPDVVIFPTTTAQVVGIVKACNRHRLPFVPRGAGTSLAGGTLAIGGGVMICLTKMKRILEINTRDRYAIVEPGVVNVWLTRALASSGFHYAPDPSSQTACTIGGNVATNSGGPHTLKYGVTVNFVRGVELVLPDGSVVETGGVTEDNPGYDLPGIIVGNEGTFGIATKITVGLTRDPEAGRTLLGVFRDVESATETVSGIIAAGIVPAALEMLDNLMIQAIEAAFGFGFPTDAGAVLIIEVDGLDAGLDREAHAIAEIVRSKGGSVQKSIAWRTPARTGICRHLEESKIGLRRDWSAEPHVLHARRRCPPHQAAAHPPVHHPGRRAPRPADRQCLPCRRWKYSSYFTL